MQLRVDNVQNQADGIRSFVSGQAERALLPPFGSEAHVALTSVPLTAPGFPTGSVPRATRKVVRFGAFEVDLHAGELRKRGVKIRLQDKPFQLLYALLEQPGELVARDELQRRLWPSGTFVDFDGSLNTAAGKLRGALSDSAENPRFVETLPRRGYRFIAPVVEETGSPRVAAKAEPVGLPFPVEVPVAQPSHAAGADEKSIAVLPFENLSSDNEQEHFCDGMTEELINALTHVDELRVVARTSVFSLKGVHRDIRKIGQELTVGMVLEGSVRKASGRLRVTAQLIHAPSGYHVWSEQYDRKVTDVFEMQEEISLSIVKALGPRLVGRRPLANDSSEPIEVRNRLAQTA